MVQIFIPATLLALANVPGAAASPDRGGVCTPTQQDDAGAGEAGSEAGSESYTMPTGSSGSHTMLAGSRSRSRSAGGGGAGSSGGGWESSGGAEGSGAGSSGGGGWEGSGPPYLDAARGPVHEPKSVGLNQQGPDEECVLPPPHPLAALLRGTHELQQQAASLLSHSSSSSSSSERGGVRSPAMQHHLSRLRWGEGEVGQLLEEGVRLRVQAEQVLGLGAALSQAAGPIVE